MITALLLAAGQGSRMQYQAKALLAFGGRTFVQQALQQLYAAGMEDIVLVTGAQREAVWASALQAEIPMREAWNPNYTKGLLSSIQSGIQHCQPQTEAILITLVDLPLLTADDYRAVCSAWQASDPLQLLRARSEGKPAHPVLIPRTYFAEILQEPPHDKGCSFLFQRYPERVVFHEITRGRMDIDTIEDYHAYVTS